MIDPLLLHLTVTSFVLFRGSHRNMLLKPLIVITATAMQPWISRRAAVSSLLVPAPSLAAVKSTEPTTFRDPSFELTYPGDYFAIRRTISGDVVRRGGVIFTAGNLGRAEVVTVERFPVQDLLIQADATSFFPQGSIKKWSDIGTRQALAEYVCERRDNEANLASKGAAPKARTSVPIDGSIRVDDTNLQVDVLTTIGATEMRVGESGAKAATPSIRRIQRARLVLLPGGKTVMAVWAGCLDDGWNSGEGEVLSEVVASFVPLADDQ